MTQVITHRGLDPTYHNYYLESSREAFHNQLTRGYGLEFDLQITRDKEIIISHDDNLKKISEGKFEADFKDLNLQDLLHMEFHGCHLVSLDEIISMLQVAGINGISAIHLKHKNHTPEFLEVLLRKLTYFHRDSFIIFDISIETARWLKKHDRSLRLAPSVAHQHDINRYNSAVGGTLLSIDQVLENKNLFDWVWLDEWDRFDMGAGRKKLYTPETFSIFKKAGLAIALASPELHGTSPGLLGGEIHEDAQNFASLSLRIQEIIQLKPDVICTDYPDTVERLILAQ